MPRSKSQKLADYNYEKKRLNNHITFNFGKSEAEIERFISLRDSAGFNCNTDFFRLLLEIYSKTL